MALLTFSAACTACGACLLTCPTHAIRPDGGRLTVRDDACTRCGECVEICPVDAIDMAPPDLIPTWPWPTPAEASPPPVAALGAVVVTGGAAGGGSPGGGSPGGGPLP